MSDDIDERFKKRGLAAQVDRVRREYTMNNEENQKRFNRMLPGALEGAIGKGILKGYLTDGKKVVLHMNNNASENIQKMLSEDPEAE